MKPWLKYDRVLAFIAARPRGYRMTEMPPVWSVVDGMMIKQPMRAPGQKDIVTRQKFTDFELMIDWMIGPKGNSGIFYRATEDTDHVYWTAPEYQLGEDSTPDSRDILTSVAAVYGFYPSIRGVDHGPNAWNTTRIVVKGKHVEHWLNGKLIAQYDYWSPEFTAKLYGDSTHRPLKFAPFKDFARATTGYIAIQGDHPGDLKLRNIKIREIK